MKITDVHAHILPRLDDGASCIEESVKMLRLAESQGITEIIATPHYSHYFKNYVEDVQIACESLKQFVKNRTNFQIQIYPGQEIMYSEDVPDLMRQGKLMTLAGSRYFLMEFQPFESYSKILRAVRTVIMLGHGIILAHVERYECLRDREKIEELLQEGARLQMNYRPVGNKWYDDTARWCRKMLKEEKIHFLGTDMHNIQDRSPRLQPAYGWMEKHLSKEYRNKICFENAEKIINNQRIE